jgi:hypothetical protein
MGEWKRANDNLPHDVAESLAYLRTGGLGEVIGMADMARRSGMAKVQMDSAMAVALGILASDALPAPPSQEGPE